MQDNENKQDAKHSLTKISEETDTPRYGGAFRDRWSDFGNSDPLAELERTYRNISPQKETKQEKLNRLYRQLHEKEKEFEKAKGKRLIATMLVFAAFYFLTLMICAGFTDIGDVLETIFSKSIVRILSIVLASIVLAWFHFWVNSTIFGQLSEMGRREREILDGIRENIRDTEKNLDN